MVKTSPAGDMVVYKVVTGPDKDKSGTITRSEFAHWARHEVCRDGDSWKRVTATGVSKKP
jgi:hypothetical protein